MRKIKHYQFGFEVWGLVLFLLVMLPNFIWFAIPAPNDILRTASSTPIIDMVSSFFQDLTIACLCFIVNRNRPPLRLSPCVIATIACIALYYIGWVFYYTGNTQAYIILLLTVPPCAAFILFSVDRNNLPALVFASAFAVCHLTFGIINFII